MTTQQALMQQALLNAYSDGVLHGMQITLTLLLGEPCDDGHPYMGAPLPEDAIRWAEQALAQSKALGPLVGEAVEVARRIAGGA